MGSFMVKNDHGIVCHASQFVRGAIVATATLSAVVCHSDDPWFRGPYGWVFDDVVMVEPVRCRGQRHLWPLSADVQHRVAQAYQSPLQPWRFMAIESESKVSEPNAI